MRAVTGNLGEDRCGIAAPHAAEQGHRHFVAAFARSGAGAVQHRSVFQRNLKPRLRGIEPPLQPQEQHDAVDFIEHQRLSRAVAA
ncbi:hypothetical protein OKA06_17085 [Novosphingobium sp. MW5]|nr:hypothetical protein [Novosphingobium sp. MW5]